MRAFFCLLAQVFLLLSSCVLAVYLAVNVALNHSNQLALEQRYIKHDWLLQHYNVGHIEADRSYLADNKMLSQFGSQLFVDATPVVHVERPVVGVITLEDVIVVATDHELILLSRQGDFMERLGAESAIPAPIQNLGLYHGEPVIQAKSGMWRSTFLMDEWEQISLQGVSWSQPHPLPDSVAEQLRQHFYGKGISYSRLFHDIRSGQVFGGVGLWLTDVFTVLLLIYSLLGAGWLLTRLKRTSMSS